MTEKVFIKCNPVFKSKSLTLLTSDEKPLVVAAVPGVELMLPT